MSNPGAFGAEAHSQCTAMSRRSGQRCKGIAVKGSPGQKCRMHGGNSEHAVGMNNGNAKSGRYSKYLPSQLEALYEEAIGNPDLLEMSDHIGMLESRIKSIMATVKSGDPVPRWAEVKELFGEVATTVLAGKQDDTIAALEKMHNILEAGAAYDRSWNDVIDTMEQLRKMADVEVKRKKELNQMIPVERVVTLMAAVGMAVKRNVTNPNEIAAVYKELALLHGSNTTPGNSHKRLPPGEGIVDVTPVRKSRRKVQGQTVDGPAPN